MIERHVAGVDGPARILARPASAQGRTEVVVTGASLAGPRRLAHRAFEVIPDRRPDCGAARLWHRLPAGDDRVPPGRGDAPARKADLARTGMGSACRCRRRKTRSGGSERRSTRCSRGWRTPSSANGSSSPMPAMSCGRPLAVVKAELEAAMRAEGKDGGSVRESLVAALEETDHLAQLAEDLLLLARAADGKLPVRTEDVQVRDLLERTQQRFARPGPRAGARRSPWTHRRNCERRWTRCAAGRHSATSSTTRCGTAPAISA